MPNSANPIKRILTLVGDPNQINTWSNIPYFFLKAGQNLGFIDAGLHLQPEKLRLNRLLWNLHSWLQFGETGGFQYSSPFLKKLFDQVKLNTEKIEFISHFPLLPPPQWSDSWTVNYYIDATLKQNFQDYGLGARIGRRISEAALEQEKQNYINAQRIICMSRTTAKSVVEYYHISPSKVHIISAGANLDENYLMTTKHPNSREHFTPLRLGFVGKDWRRKGLLYLLQVADIVYHRGIAVEVLVIGSPPKKLPVHPLVRANGFIDKAKNTQQFVEIVRSFHFGCLFSSSEAFGISNRECLRLGVPVLATHVGGIPDTLPEGMGFLFEPNTPPETVADLLEFFVHNPSEYNSLRQRVADHASEFSWQKTIGNFIQVWQGSEDFLYETICVK